MLTEPQSPALFSRQLSGCTVFTIPAISLGRAGEGVLLAVRQHLPFSVSKAASTFLCQYGSIYLSLSVIGRQTTLTARHHLAYSTALSGLPLSQLSPGSSL